jgi:hypothetical protein
MFYSNGEFLDQLNNYHLPKEDPIPCSYLMEQDDTESMRANFACNIRAGTANTFCSFIANLHLSSEKYI